ncbi:nucleotide exchange factor GrpE [Melioribacteraceae bacterium 4301-Me]|uniref:nucleotide exchange factor GrpE n=1 Tax=Pyranulibacter aquaticus TaxID=3163344 RepID=UPI003599F4EA
MKGKKDENNLTNNIEETKNQTHNQNDERKTKTENTTEENKLQDTDSNQQQLTEEQNNQTNLEKALKKIEELEKQNSELKDLLLRKAAEFENYKKRIESEQKNFLSFANENLILDILPVYNDLERSLIHIDDDNNFESVKKGLKLVYDKFSKVLESQGVKKIEAKGLPFDFNLHEALMQQQADNVPPHTVLQVVEPGYMLKDKVIKHAKVIVSQDLQHDQEKESRTNLKDDKVSEGTNNNE